ncbi:uncharacterized protein J8A68_000949 [[Candida] subhashii]|uniref:F-box domain-containing protein n=1 Tax=[Candida] subhashii TaxID=561895 RepID=A0A8J5QM21_9ASCO|nr:uncharacterized protein J8A68_000949 [[Candida] subhashii]KAG7665547.1 hypothetical protein J8A68_000949 [[Candida] subhashii]
MKKYQLIGKRGSGLLSSFHSNNNTKKSSNIQYPQLHLCSLPFEILLLIFNQLDQRDLLSISLTCKRFNQFINKYFLYNKIHFTTTKQFQSFANNHLSNSTSSGGNKINYLTTVEFNNPQIKRAGSSNYKSNIAGSYQIEVIRPPNEISHDDFVQSLNKLFMESFGLKCLIINEISPDFQFPDNIQQPYQKQVISRFLRNKKTTLPKPKRSLEKLILKTQSGWSIPLKYSHISLICNHFNVIHQLQLINFIIDDTKSILSNDTTASPHVADIESLILDSCNYTNSFKKPKSKPIPNPMFHNVSQLELKNITNDNCLSLIDYIKLNNSKLYHICIDMNSSLFYLDGQQFNFGKFNPFFKIICGRLGGYKNVTNITLTNFGLFEYLKQEDDKSDVDSWVEPPTDNFETFMKYISEISKLTIVLKESLKKVRTCIKCGHKEQLSRDKLIDTLSNHEWKVLLSQLEINNHNSIKIFNRKHKLLYNSASYNTHHE